MSTDIIICYGHRKIYPGKPLLFGSRDKELSKMVGQEWKIDMIDLDWQAVNLQRYRSQILDVYNAKEAPIKYIVLPDLMDVDDIDDTISFGRELYRRGVFQVGLLPVKDFLDLNDLPGWIRPALPIDSNYGNKLREEYTLEQFREYHGEIHTLGGSQFNTILNFASVHAPHSMIKSLDMNSVCKGGIYGKYLHINGKRWVQTNLGYYDSIERSFVNLKIIHRKIERHAQSYRAIELFRIIKDRQNVAKNF